METITREELAQLIEEFTEHPDGIRAEALALAELLHKYKEPDDYLDRAKMVALQIGNGDFQPQDEHDLESDALHDLEFEIGLHLGLFD